ncbi:MAG TPA: choice-of-anchor J domain-containing protein, partial [Ohtaekwangia sp.]|uniref:choice-of-anchor J domain-containing protein n=1 Tax=Ohtaekwangia sp. TaxID=2066019 RepID=UPI002F95CF1B
MSIGRAGGRLLVMVCLLVLVYLKGWTQDRCGITEVMQNLRNKNTVRESDKQFENWLLQRQASRLANGRTETETKYYIPVVVHVIHRGEAVGSGTNIPDAQIISQIKVLNNDYNRLNADASNTPSEFTSVAGSFNVEFVLAKQTPDGQATNGIVRVKGSKTSWSTSDDATLKATSYWPAEDYLNIWVTNLSSTLLGYAQFPVSDLDGLEDASDNRLTDGVVIDYAVFGSTDDGSFNIDSEFNKGRTATHEIGHYLGLRHIWGDDNGACGGDGDYVSDTPDQGSETSGCPSNPQTSCSVHNMFQNYMDYTDDACMNLFTQGQVSRMITVMENSPRRVTLPQSKGLYDPVVYSNNLDAIAIVSPAANQCAGTITPQVTIKNTGSNSASAAKIQLRINGTVTETKSVTFSPVLASLQSTTISFSSVTLTSGSTAFAFEILTMNGAADENADDNIQSVTAQVPYTIQSPFEETFATLPSTWNIVNGDAGITWAVKQAPNADASNTAAYLNFFNGQNSESSQDVLITPIFDLSNASAPYLTFDVAYALYQGYTDELQVYILSDCSNNLSNGTELYDKSGSTLATVLISGSAFTPSNASQWRTEIIDLKKYIGQSHVQLAFVGISGGGNNLYLDNINVVQTITEDVALTDIVSPAPVRCTTAATPKLQITNQSAVNVTSLQVVYSINKGTAQTISLSNIEGLTPGASIEIPVSSITLKEGQNTLSYQLTYPNGYTDIDVSDNTYTKIVVVNTASDIIPLRENFDSNSFEDQWVIVNPAGGMDWQTITTNYNQSVYFNAANNTTEGDKAWLVSPTLNFSSATTASVFFDLSYRYKEEEGNKNSQDNLQVLASTDCGVTYDKVLFDETGTSLSINQNTVTTAPAAASDWQRKYINLTALAGQEQVRLAFVFTNDNGSNVYLDNIEFYTSDDPNPNAVKNPFVVYDSDPITPNDFYITFNLSERQPVQYQLVDVMGRQVTA